MNTTNTTNTTNTAFSSHVNTIGDSRDLRFSFPEHICAQLDEWLQKYPADQRQSAVLGGLLVLQDFNGGFLTETLMQQLAQYIDMPAISVYEVATFYSMYDLKPTGKHKISVCDNISCMLRGSEAIIQHLEKRCNVKAGHTSEDGQFTLKRVECMGACCGAPMLEVNKQFHENLTVVKVDEIIDNLLKTEKAQGAN